MTAPRFHSLRIASLHHDTADSVVLGFVVPDALRPAYRFTPGQFLTLRATIDGAELRRPYSLCSDPDDPEPRVGIRHLPGGRFSGFANQMLRVGDRLDVMTPDGRFGLPPEPGARRTLLFCAAGSGITPILSILRATLAREAGRAILLYANRTRASIMFRAEIEALKDRYLDRLAVAHFLSREIQDGSALARLDPPALRRLLTATAPGGVDHAFLCGPPALTDALADALTDALADVAVAGRVHRERFTPAEDAAAPLIAPAPAPGTAAAHATVTFDGVRTRIPLGAKDTILGAGLRAGLNLPYACRGGMCCTCRARLTEGEVAMDANYSLEPWEMAAGYVLTCQARARTAELAVDYDQM